jgi:hypothetical protein
MARTGDVAAVVLQAAASEPELAAAAQAGRESTRENVRRFWTAARDDGLLAPGVDLDWLADTAAALSHLETFLLLRRTTGWSPAGYRDWLATTWLRLAAAAG